MIDEHFNMHSSNTFSIDLQSVAMELEEPETKSTVDPEVRAYVYSLVSAVR